MKRRLTASLAIALAAQLSASVPDLGAHEAIYQWAVPTQRGFAFLWIPESCERLRAVILAQHNMSEEGLLAHPRLRAALADLDIGIVWIAPPVEVVFDFHQGAGERMMALLQALSGKSGYDELGIVPLIPIGHSALASFPWNFAAWAPQRTLAAISLHGDSPLSTLTGSGKPNPDWGSRTLDGVPGLMVMAEYEWLDERLAPALAYRREHPGAPLAFLSEPGTGHFDISEDTVDFIAQFLRKAMHYRLPENSDASFYAAPELIPIRASDGWLVTPNRLHSHEPFWAFDKEMALATQHFRETQIGKAPQLLGFSYTPNGSLIRQQDTHAQIHLDYRQATQSPNEFSLYGRFLNTVDGGSPNTTLWTGLPAGSSLSHPSGGEAQIRLSRITGPVVQTGTNTFRLKLNRTASTQDPRNADIWLLASHSGDTTFKSAVQQARLSLPAHGKGSPQSLTFPTISDQPRGTRAVGLKATSDAGLAVDYYVLAGPAYVRESVLYLTDVPPRARFPITVTVVAYQLGQGSAPRVRAAAPITQHFQITAPSNALSK